MLDEYIDYENLLLFLLAEEDIDEEYFLFIAENEIRLSNQIFLFMDTKSL